MTPLVELLLYLVELRDARGCEPVSFAPGLERCQ